EPIHNAIVWQCRRTADKIDQLKSQGHAELVLNKTGLVLDAYFSGTKIAYILDTVPGAREKAENGELMAGTIDSWLIWNLTGKHVTDVSNASRTLLLDIHSASWGDELLEIFNVPRVILPEVSPSSSKDAFGRVKEGHLLAGVPITGVAGDQQAALFGQACFEPGQAKNTYGTGCFLLHNIGHEVKISKGGLLTTIAWQLEGEPLTYALEGSVFIGGAVFPFLKNMGIISSHTEIESLARSVIDSEGVYFVPAFVGLGAPYWDQNARGTIVGLTGGSQPAHLVRAALEGIAHQVADVLDTMSETGVEINELRVDGGASANNLLMEIQSNVIGKPVFRPINIETTALGAAYLAGLGVGLWASKEQLTDLWEIEKAFDEKGDEEKRLKNRIIWKKAVNRAKDWI
ncbi:MAG: glycerol kinase GlpK, partial [Candidatus Heimdallarchaeota archaeon]|nr:glycerol kinase GlpK [Candidatus Heimdallarchaeota archaeon]MCK5050013.1 glycerol kinase GlpK [Candidatus Heimdallarchaeota archaeon]